MRPWMSVTLVSVLAALLVGCEGDWTSGGGVESWNESYNWVNFSGVYKGLGGGLLVTDYSATPGTSGVTNSASQAFVSNGADEQSVSLGHKPVVRGSVVVSVGNFSFTDEDGDGIFTGSNGSGGEVNYSTGVIVLRFGGNPPNSGSSGTVSYNYSVSGNAGTGSAGSGSSGIKVYSFTVFQEGNVMTITDNNGSVYEGNFGSIRSSAGATSSPAAGDTVVGQFECNGVSAAGFSVSIVGTLQGVVSGDGDVLGNRQMFGTWIEDGGRTGDVNGEASPIAIVVTPAAGETTTE